MMNWDHDDAIRGANRRYRVVKVDDSGTQQLVNLKGLKNEEPEEVWRPQMHGFTSVPPADSDGFMVAMGDRSDRMLYQDGGHKKYRPRNLKEGDVALYDMHGNIVKMVEAGLGIAHAKAINLKIGKGQDVSGDDGSKEPGADDVNISIAMTAEGVLITVEDSSIQWKPGELTLKSAKVVLDSPAVHLGGDGGTLIGLCGGGCATRVYAI